MMPDKAEAVLAAANAVNELLGEGVHVFTIDPDSGRWNYYRMTSEEIASVLALRAAVAALPTEGEQ